MSNTLWTIQGIIGDGQHVELGLEPVAQGDIITELQIEVPEFGQVSDAVTGLPISGVQAQLVYAGEPTPGELVSLPLKYGLPQNNPAITTSGGYYHFTVNPGYYRVLVSALWYQPAGSDPVLVQGDSVAVNLTLNPVIDENLALSLKADKAYSNVGDVIRFTVRLTNTANVAQTGVTVINYLPAGLEYVRDSAAGEYDPIARTVTWRIDKLGSSQAVEIEIDTGVQALPEGTTVTNTAVAKIDGSDAYVWAEAETKVANWPGLHLTKRASHSEASIGSTVRYEVVLANRDNIAVPVASKETLLQDTLPEGFVYVARSSYVNGSQGPEPQVNGRQLTWNVGTVLPGETVVVHYSATVSLGAVGSTGINVVMASGKTPTDLAFKTDPVQAKVKVRTGLFGSLGTIVGTVYIDENGNSVKDTNEPGIAEATLYTDDGKRIVTDQYGRYSIGGLIPGMRSLKLVLVAAGDDQPASGAAEEVVPERDPSLEPRTGRGSIAASTSVRLPESSGSAAAYEASRFVQVHVGGLAVVDFGISPDEVPTALGRVALPRRLTVGVLDVKGSHSDGIRLGYGSLFLVREDDEGNWLLLRYTTPTSATLEALRGEVPAPVLLGDQSRVDNLLPGAGATQLQIEYGDIAVTYGEFSPEETRENRFASRTDALSGVKAVIGADPAKQISVYGANVQGAKQTATFDVLGTSGPYVLGHVPVVPHSEEVWLVTFDEDEEIDRTRLVRDQAHRIDYESGILWLTEVTSGWDEAMNRRILEVSYRSEDESVVGRILGLRLDMSGAYGRLGVSASQEENDGTRQIIGIDGKLTLGERLEVAYEIAQSTNNGLSPATGQGLFGSAQARLTDRLQLLLKAEDVTGTFVQPGGQIVPDGQRIDLEATYDVNETMSLVYEREHERKGSSAAIYNDSVSLQGSPTEELSYALEIGREGATANPFDSERVTNLAAMLGWKLPERQSLSFKTKVAVDHKDERGLPLEATYQYALSKDTSLALGYQQAIGSSQGGAWTVALETSKKDGLTAYTRLRSDAKDQTLWTLGAQHSWDHARSRFEPFE